MSELNGETAGEEGRKAEGFNRYGFLGGRQLTDANDDARLPIKVIIGREKKWRHMCSNWEYFWTKSRIKLRNRCRKGIPDSMRCEVWQRLCSSPMVLVPRAKVIVNDSQASLRDDVSRNSSFAKGGLIRSFLSTSSEFKRMPPVITTEPSFRIKRSNAEARRKMILRKLYGEHGPPAEEEEIPCRSNDGNSLIVSSSWLDSPANRSVHSAFRSAHGFPSCDSLSSRADPTWSARNSPATVSMEPLPPGTAAAEQVKRSTITQGPNGNLEPHRGSPVTAEAAPSPESLRSSSGRVFGRSEARPTANKVDSDDGLGRMMTSSEPCKPGGNIQLPPLAVPTSPGPNSPGRVTTTFRSFTLGRRLKSTTSNVVAVSEVTSAPVAASSSSGGYASLSTDSSAAVGGAAPPLTGDSHYRTSSFDSYRSSLSSLSAIFQGYDSQAAAADGSQNRRTSGRGHLNSLGGMGDGARATLTAPGDPIDPVALYHSYCRAEGQPSVCDQIQRDIGRQFPNHELFNQKDGHGQQTLFTLLKAYTVRHPEKGYCQGQAPLAAVLIMYMPEVDAYWTFNEVCERYLDAYYDDGLERVQIDAQILYTLLKGSYSKVYEFLRKNNVDPILIVLEWFMCVFTRTLPWGVVLRVLDMFFCEGKVVLFRVALVLLRRMFGTEAQRKECNGLDEILLRVRDIQSVVKNPDEFVNETLAIGLTPRDLAQEAIVHSRKWEQNKVRQKNSGRL